MEVLGGVSSAFAVVSLAIELGDKVKMLYDFWGSIQDAPREIRAISQDLKIISDVLDDIRQESEIKSARPYSRAIDASLAALEQCEESIEPLQKLVEKLERGLTPEKQRSRKWSAFKAAWKGDRIQKFQDSLQNMKLSLMLARQNSTR